MTRYALRRHDSPANVGHLYDSATEAHLAIISLYADDLDLHVVPVEDDDRDRRTPDRHPPRTL